MDNHDTGYRLLFSHPEMIRDLLLGFVPEDWVRELDLDSLEKVNGSYVTDDLRARSDDVIWRVRWGPKWVYIYLLLEFQSQVDPYMAVRILAYVALLYQDLVRTGQLGAAGRLPPVLPIVLYNGEPRWQAATSVVELMDDMPEALRRWQVGSHYLLLDEGTWDDSQLAPLQNLVAALFRLEGCRTPADLRGVIRLLIDWLQDASQASLRRSLTEWLRRVLLPRRLPGVTLREVQDLQEVNSMLSERVKEWTRDWREEGRQQGSREGRQDTARRLIARTEMDDAMIAEVTGLAVFEVAALRAL